MQGNGNSARPLSPDRAEIVRRLAEKARALQSCGVTRYPPKPLLAEVQNDLTREAGRLILIPFDHTAELAKEAEALDPSIGDTLRPNTRNERRRRKRTGQYAPKLMLMPGGGEGGDAWSENRVNRRTSADS